MFERNPGIYEAVFASSATARLRQNNTKLPSGTGVPATSPTSPDLRRHPQPLLSRFATVACGDPRYHPLRLPGLQQASPWPTPDVPNIDCLGKRVHVESHPRPGKCPVPTEGRASIGPRLLRHAERVGAGAWSPHSDYCLERRHPAARASFSVQNHRSPFDVLIRVRS